MDFPDRPDWKGTMDGSLKIRTTKHTCDQRVGGHVQDARLLEGGRDELPRRRALVGVDHLAEEVRERLALLGPGSWGVDARLVVLPDGVVLVLVTVDGVGRPAS